MLLNNLFVIFLFAFGCIGITSIIVDGEIFKKLREYLKLIGPEFINKLLSCYQCSGFWVGIIIGSLLFLNDFFKEIESGFVVFTAILLSGGASSALSYFWALYLTYLEANSLIKLEEEQPFDYGNNQENQ